MEPSLLPMAVPTPGATKEPMAPPTMGRAVLATDFSAPPRALPMGDLMNLEAFLTTLRARLPRNWSSSSSELMLRSSMANWDSRLSSLSDSPVAAEVSFVFLFLGPRECGLGLACVVVGAHVTVLLVSVGAGWLVGG